MMQIPLTQGLFALVDDSDYEELSEHLWYAHYQPRCADDETYYAMRESAKDTTIYMHRVILDAPSLVRVDHKNKNGLDNQRDNLRLCTNSQNQANKSKQNGVYSSSYKGVSWVGRVAKWRAYIVINNKQYHLGYFSLESSAAFAYNDAALNSFGEFALLNEIVS